VERRRARHEKRISLERIEEALETNPTAVVANCPFCLTMLQDGLKAKEKNEQIPVYDLSEMILSRL
jgi:heterodisulfide reductase subunit D